MKRLAILLCIALVMCAGGCGTYYRITDPATDTVYYTSDLKERQGSAITFRDGATESDVTVHGARIQRVSKAEYESNRSGNH